MATSLAKQLKQLAIPGQPSHKQATSKKQPSLLYAPEKAATLSTDEIYALGCNGLSELITTDPSFSRYEATLFQESCKGFERSTQTREVLEEVASQRLPVSVVGDLLTVSIPQNFPRLPPSTLHLPSTQSTIPQIDWSLLDKEDTPSHHHAEEPGPVLQLLPSDSSSESEDEETAEEE